MVLVWSWVYWLCRSGRTGRAGRTGVCVTLVGRNKEGLIPFIEKKAGVKFERRGAPQPADMARVAGDPLPWHLRAFTHYGNRPVLVCVLQNWVSIDAIDRVDVLVSPSLAVVDASNGPLAGTTRPTACIA